MPHFSPVRIDFVCVYVYMCISDWLCVCVVPCVVNSKCSFLLHNKTREATFMKVPGSHFASKKRLMGRVKPSGTWALGPFNITHTHTHTHRPHTPWEWHTRRVTPQVKYSWRKKSTSNWQKSTHRVLSRFPFHPPFRPLVECQAC